MFWQRHHPIIRYSLIATNAVLPPACFILWGLHEWWWLAVTFAATLVCHAAILVAIFQPRCPWLGPLVRRFRTERQAVWLTIDDGPDGENTTALAEALRVRGVRATFFVVGERARQYPEAVRSVLAAGHSLANHTLHHPRATMWCLSAGRARVEVQGGAAALRDFGVSTSWFRAAVGHKSPGLHPALRRHGCRLISWSAGGRDGYGPDPEPFIRRVLARVQPGAILLMHETRPHTLATVLAVVDALRAQGYEFVVPSDAELEGA